MADFLQALRPYLETAYFLSGPLLLIVASFGLGQIRLMKRDIALRQERAAKEKAIEYASRYARLSKLAMKAVADRTKANLKDYNGMVGDFSMASIPLTMLPISKKRHSIVSWLPVLNELDAIASAFVSGVADERTGFNIFGRTFCQSVKRNYDLIALERGNHVLPDFQSVVDLYRTWSSRLAKVELAETQSKIQTRMVNITEPSLPKIGE